eukprot:TRINITY_DN4051_c0_g1_i1.p1 TRINITY_DN4051_c0_g1~~TRINITY_DN4051_c0_g1_i1.p1  ORF type:complete len:586 (+),score=36.61 TRINITY_DN4051_c0_g1_i1:61-1818(+)
MGELLHHTLPLFDDSLQYSSTLSHSCSCSCSCSCTSHQHPSTASCCSCCHLTDSSYSSDLDCCCSCCCDFHQHLAPTTRQLIETVNHGQQTDQPLIEPKTPSPTPLTRLPAPAEDEPEVVVWSSIDTTDGRTGSSAFKPVLLRVSPPPSVTSLSLTTQQSISPLSSLTRPKLPISNTSVEMQTEDVHEDVPQLQTSQTQTAPQTATYYTQTVAVSDKCTETDPLPVPTVPPVPPATATAETQTIEDNEVESRGLAMVQQEDQLSQQRATLEKQEQLLKEREAAIQTQQQQLLEEYKKCMGDITDRQRDLSIKETTVNEQLLIVNSECEKARLNLTSLEHDISSRANILKEMEERLLQYKGAVDQHALETLLSARTESLAAMAHSMTEQPATRGDLYAEEASAMYIEAQERVLKQLIAAIEKYELGQLPQIDKATVDATDTMQQIIRCLNAEHDQLTMKNERLLSELERMDKYTDKLKEELAAKEDTMLGKEKQHHKLLAEMETARELYQAEERKYCESITKLRTQLKKALQLNMTDAATVREKPKPTVLVFETVEEKFRRAHQEALQAKLKEKELRAAARTLVST